MRWFRRRRPKAEDFSADDEPTEQERRENAWWEAGWVEWWKATAANPTGLRTRYWVRRGDPGGLKVFRGTHVPPATDDEAMFYVRDGRVFRDDRHPDGPSSVPYYAVRRHGVYPSEGFPAGPDGRRHFEVICLRRYGVRTVIRANPKTRGGPA